MSNVLVLGGTSWVGGEIARVAVGRGHDVTCLARGEAGDPPAAVTFVRADRGAPGAYKKVLDTHWDMVFDVSRQPGHVRGAIDALRTVASHWTFVSTSSVYADQSAPLTEDSPLLEALVGEVAGPDAYGEGKVACEEAVRDLSHHLVVRVGLIGGPGDRSDRLGYYVSRFAAAGEGPVLVPDVVGQPMQVIDVRDLAQWIVLAAESGVTGIVQATGESTTVGELVRLSAEVANGAGRQLLATAEWLETHGVEQWMGPRSLPLWLPPSHHGMGMLDDSRSVEHGLERRPYGETLRDTLADERERGLDRERRAGLTREDELELIADLRG